MHANRHLYNLQTLLKAKLSVTKWPTHPVVMPKVGLLANDSESLLRMNRTQEASSLVFGIDSSVSLFNYNLPLAIVSPLQEAGNGSSYVKVGRELPKKEYVCSGL